MKKVNVALVGATGMVGRTFIKVLEERNFPIDKVYMFSSAKSAGTVVKFAGQDIVVEELNEKSFDDKNIQIWHEPGINNLKLILNREQGL